MAKVRADIAVSLRYSIKAKQTYSGLVGGDVPFPRFMDEVTLSFSEGWVWSEDAQQEVTTGKAEVNVRGSRRGYLALARYWLALSRLAERTLGSEFTYHDHFDEVTDSKGEPSAHVIIHMPYEPD